MLCYVDRHPVSVSGWFIAGSEEKPKKPQKNGRKMEKKEATARTPRLEMQQTADKQSYNETLGREQSLVFRTPLIRIRYPWSLSTDVLSDRFLF